VVKVLDAPNAGPNPVLAPALKCCSIQEIQRHTVRQWSDSFVGGRSRCEGTLTAGRNPELWSPPCVKNHMMPRQPGAVTICFGFRSLICRQPAANRRFAT
jgi:hypothetical protein